MTLTSRLMNDNLCGDSAGVQAPRIDHPRPLMAYMRDSSMHIVGIIVAVLAAGALWYWRFKMLHEAGSEVVDAVGRVRGAYRMRKFKKQAEGSVLASVTDPALAAAIFLYALANERAETLHASETEIAEQLKAIIADADRDEIISYARWAARDIADARDVVRRFKPLWREKLTRDERNDLVAMAEAVMAVGGGEPEHNQQLSFFTLRSALAPEPTR